MSRITPSLIMECCPSLHCCRCCGSQPGYQCPHRRCCCTRRCPGRRGSRSRWHWRPHRWPIRRVDCRIVDGGLDGSVGIHVHGVDCELGVVHDVEVDGNLVVGVDSVGDHICVVGCGLSVVHDVEVDIGVDGSIVLLVLTVLPVSMSRELVVNSLTQLLVTHKVVQSCYQHWPLVIDGTFLVVAHLVAVWFVLKILLLCWPHQRVFLL